MTILALLGAKALYLLWAWLLGSIVASAVTERKGYGSRLGLTLGLLLSMIGAVVALLLPVRADSTWSKHGPFGRRRVAEGARARGSGDPPAVPPPTS
jgi:hypothetical protein